MSEDAITDAIEKGLRESTRRSSGRIIWLILRTLFQNPRYPFIAAAQLRLIEAGLPPVRAWECAAATLNDFLKSENIEFGDPQHDWSQAGARALMEEFEIQYWESHQ